MEESHRYTNHLITESSPYLLQHAHNPVDWYPWGDEAFARAKAEDKPILVSIGYSACHWCHVMEHESFEDEATAKIMNEHFINIKVDMEERPDVDQIYMTFVQLTTGRGGWPMNVFLTPEKLPFFGGTYFPPVSRYNMPSFQNVLLSISDAFQNKRDDLVASAAEIVTEIRRVGSAGFAPAAFDENDLDFAFQSFTRSFDAKNGGFGGAPKFPQAMSLEFLLRYWKRTANENALDIVKTTATKMANGGIFDQLGGGFHRYTVDAIWLVPHFEKMLYDNAQLIRIFLHLYQIENSRNGADGEFFKQIAIATLEYVKREMLDNSGAFYSTQDADSEGVEGKFFVWSPAEVLEILGETDAAEFSKYFEVSNEGNFEGSSILNVNHQTVPITEAPRAEILAKMFAVREKRIKPFRDEKVLTAWNGLMLAAFAEAAAILDNPEYLQIAKNNADFLLNNLVVGDKTEMLLLRTWKDGKAKLNAYIEDYANLADGLIELYQVSGELEYLLTAKSLADTMITEFWDAEDGGFFFTSNNHEELLVRSKDYYDNATPSGNSVAADVLLKLHKFFGDDRYERFAMTVLRLAAGQVKRHPQGFGRMLSAMEFKLDAIKEVVIIGNRGNTIERELWQKYFPGKIVAVSDDPKSEAVNLPLLADKDRIDGRPTVYVCENFVCERPTFDLESLK